jgi:hypothetical protein
MTTLLKRTEKPTILVGKIFPATVLGLNHLPTRWPLTIVVNEEGGFALEVDGASRLGSKCETGALVLATVIASEFSAVGIDRDRGCFVCGRGKIFPPL